jgi:hypothetical protein
MAQHDDLPVPPGRDPIELDNPPFAHEGLVSVPGIVGALERDQRSLDRRHFNNEVI